jgi:hypothetical protein
MRLQRITITVPQLKSVPDAERGLIVVLSHALNEINVLNKLVFLSTQFDAEPRWKAHVHAAQTFILARPLVGKINEAWQVVQSGYHGSRLSKTYDTLLEDSAQAALSELKKYFGRKNLVNAVRNSFAFHYSVEHAKTEIPDDTPPEDLAIYLHESNGNSIYYFAEYLMSKALIDSISPERPEDALDALLSEMSAAIAWLNEFVQGLLFVILDRFIGEAKLKESVVTVELGAVVRSSDAKIPFFIEVVPPNSGSAA